MEEVEVDPHMSNYGNTIAGSPLGKRIFIYFEKKKVRLSKIEFINFYFLGKNY